MNHRQGWVWEVLVLAITCTACGGGSTHAAPPAKPAATGKAPKGACKAGALAECSGAKCAKGKLSVATCSAASKYGACSCQPASVLDETSGTWAMMGYDATSDYFNPDETKLGVDNAGKLEEKWRFTVAGYPAGAPAIAEGKVFVTATGGMYALNFRTGAMLWMRDDINATSSPAYRDGAIYVHTVRANLYKLDAKDGTTIWGPVHTYELMTCDGTSSPILADDRVLVGHSCGVPEVMGNADQEPARGGVEAYSLKDGSHLWTYWTVPESGENGAMVWSSVSIDLEAGVVYASTGNNYTVGGEHSDAIHAIDLETGERKWTSQVRTGDTWSIPNAASGPDSDFGANPVLGEIDGQKIVAAGDKLSSFWALDRETGDTLWNVPALSPSRSAANGGVLNNGAFDGKYFYVAANQPLEGGALLHALDPRNGGADAWDPQTIAETVWGCPTLANGLLVVPAGTALNIYDASSGQMLNSFQTGGSIAGAAAIVDGKIVVKSGLQYYYDPSAQNNNQVICYGLP